MCLSLFLKTFFYFLLLLLFFKFQDYRKKDTTMYPQLDGQHLCRVELIFEHFDFD